MKKYFFGIMAALVIVATSAFTIIHNAHKPTTDSYIFYQVNSGQIDPNAPLNTDPMTLQEFQSSGLATCPTGNALDCVRGWIDPNNATATGTPDAVIKKAL
jgi:hypothetical protein